ncbi:MAG: AAA family ATPase [Lachnospiraceae bacterium]|nr:AAA family ATPase [Lachnospiraceae bacterium]
MANFYLVCGVSGSGKTVLSNKIIKKNKHIKLIDADSYYEKYNGDECIRDNIFEVWMEIFKDLHECEINNEDVLLTTTALTVAQRNQFTVWFPTFEHHLLWVIATREECISGNLKRRRHVPLDVIMKQWKETEYPNASEKDYETITHITNKWNGKYSAVRIKNDITQYIDL